MMRVMVRNAAVVWLGILGVACGIVACGSSTDATTRPGNPDGGGGLGGSGATGGVSGFGTGGTPTGITTTKKLDLLLLVDNSATMSAKQPALGNTVANLVRKLTSVQDLHVGAITSSLGSNGTTTCSGTDDLNDRAHLLPTLTRGASLNLPKGFIEWTPSVGAAALDTQVRAMVQAAGQDGCGYEAQLEAVYRFLADPFPPLSFTLTPCNGSAMCATPQGTDTELLAQRKAFLRPDSAVAVVILSDESDCSTKYEGQSAIAQDTHAFLPAASSACATNPNDPCCYSCLSAVPAGCTADPACTTTPTLTAATDNANLRCFDQKRRFGVDYLYPIQRYANALRKPSLCTTAPDLGTGATCPARSDGTPGDAKNPLFSDLAGTGAPVRDPSMVYLLGIVGVPWQDIAATSDAQGTPYPPTELHYMSPSELVTKGIWDVILGNPNPGSNAPPVLPSDPHMRASIDPRAGLPGPSAAYMADPINGHDWNVSERNDLQYACIFPFPQTGTCTDRQCDCFGIAAGDNNPVCQTPSGTYEEVQHFGKGYPGLRELELVKSLGPNGLAASICARNLTDPQASDYGYAPAFDSLAAALAKNVK